MIQCGFDMSSDAVNHVNSWSCDQDIMDAYNNAELELWHIVCVCSESDGEWEASI